MLRAYRLPKFTELYSGLARPREGTDPQGGTLYRLPRLTKLLSTGRRDMAAAKGAAVLSLTLCSTVCFANDKYSLCGGGES